MQKEFDQIDNRLQKYQKSIIQEELPMSVFIDDGSKPEDRLNERITRNSEKSYQIYKVFKKQRPSRCKLLDFHHVDCLIYKKM